MAAMRAEDSSLASARDDKPCKPIGHPSESTRSHGNEDGHGGIALSACGVADAARAPSTLSAQG